MTLKKFDVIKSRGYSGCAGRSNVIWSSYVTSDAPSDVHDDEDDHDDSDVNVDNDHDGDDHDDYLDFFFQFSHLLLIHEKHADVIQKDTDNESQSSDGAGIVHLSSVSY